MFFAGIYRDKDDVHKGSINRLLPSKEKVQRNLDDLLSLALDLNTTDQEDVIASKIVIY